MSRPSPRSTTGSVAWARSRASAARRGWSAPGVVGLPPHAVVRPLAGDRGGRGCCTYERVGTERVRPRLVPRRRLTERLAGATSAQLITIVAPAGYGKTTLLCDWDAEDARPFAWVTLDAEHNDPACLETSLALALALQGIEPDGAVLVIDDLQMLRAPAAQAALAALVADRPPGITVAVASRAAPALPVARLRAEDRLVELGPAELALDLDETAQLLRLAGLEPGRRGVRRAVVADRGLAGRCRARRPRRRRLRRARGVRWRRPRGRRLPARRGTPQPAGRRQATAARDRDPRHAVGRALRSRPGARGLGRGVVGDRARAAPPRPPRQERRAIPAPPADGRHARGRAPARRPGAGGRPPSPRLRVVRPGR